MSRIGKKPVHIPQGVEITLSDGKTSVKGPKGTLSQKISDDINITIDKENNILNITPVSNDKKIWSKWGLYRVLINNMIIGVTKGFQKALEMEGVGYRAAMKDKKLQISAGYSQPVIFNPGEGITLAVEGVSKIIVSGIDKQLVGQTAADIRSIRPPEPYKGKGIHYQGEHIIRKAGKTGLSKN